MLTWRWWKYFPSQLKGPSWLVHALTIRSCASQKRAIMCAGRWVPADISYGTPRTNPHSRRPPEDTSTIAISSATRPGACTLAVGVRKVGKGFGAGHRLEPGGRDGVAVRRPVVVGGDEAIVGAPQEQRGDGDPVQPPPELRVMEVRLPGVECRCLPIARDDRQPIVGQRGVIEPGARGVGALEPEDL